ncbi:LapA family protein [Moraxella nasovis]|uniref:LapA family protein n=1 Tax=Moraxella nasovis TaxID=2904121 RepID=UPI001F60C364|nr:LapA family protein [Moraxella nasovis]UNU73107.1 LapA family protein [Moraxella nasovis]
MHIVLIILLTVVFAYSIALVLINNSEVAVNLMFSNVPSMNLGLLLVITIFLGVLIGILLALLLFKVPQNKWEISRLRKELQTTQTQLSEANATIARQNTLLEAAPPVISGVADVHNTTTTPRDVL